MNDLADPRDYPGPDDASLATVEERVAQMLDDPARIHELMDEAEWEKPREYGEAIVRFMHEHPEQLIAMVKDRAFLEARIELDADLARTASAAVRRFFSDDN